MAMTSGILYSTCSGARWVTAIVMIELLLRQDEGEPPRTKIAKTKIANRADRKQGSNQQGTGAAETGRGRSLRTAQGLTQLGSRRPGTPGQRASPTWLARSVMSRPPAPGRSRPRGRLVARTPGPPRRARTGQAHPPSRPGAARAGH